MFRDSSKPSKPCRNAFPDLVLAIAGSPTSGSSMFDNLPALAAPLGDRVRFLGRISDADKVRFYQHAELFVFPSTYEGFGLMTLGGDGLRLPRGVIQRVIAAGGGRRGRAAGGPL